MSSPNRPATLPLPGGYRLQVEAEQLDVWRFEALVAEAQRIVSAALAHDA